MFTPREATLRDAPISGPGGPVARGTGPAGRPRAVVIGAGVGGLAAAARLGARGFDVTVCDRLDGPGGRAYVWRQDGYTFDAGPTIITAPFVFEDLWRICGRDFAADVTLKPLDPFYRIRFDDGDCLDCSGDREKMLAGIARIAPGDVDGYRRFEGDSRRIYDFAFERMAHEPFHDFMKMVVMAPTLVRLGGHRSVYSYVSSRVKSEKIRFALSFHPLFIGGNPFNTTSFYCLINHLEQGWGVNYAMGGTGALVQAMADLVGHVGGRIRYGADVAEITTRDGRASGVRLTSGETLPAEVVVCNADPATVYRRMIPSVRRRRWTDAKLDRMNYSMSVFVWYFGTDRRWEDVPHHTIVLGPRYKGLLTDIFRHKRLTEDFSLYLHRPSASDPGVAPPGGDAFYALVPVPNLDSGDDWAALAEPYRRRVQERLEQTVLPGLGRHVVTQRLLTPPDFRDRLGSERGAAFGMEPQLLQSAWFRPHNRSEEVAGLYFVGAGTHPGAGLPGVMSSARVVDEMIPAAAAVAPHG
jgi:phytoene desaturase